MSPHALVVGESLVDVVRAADGTVAEHPGGSAANVAVALARLGRPVHLATSLADDRHGRLVAEHLQQSGVCLTADPHVARRTSTATATIDAAGAATYAFDLDWRLGVVPVEPAPLVLHVCSIGALLEPGASTVRDVVSALAGRSVVSYDLNLRPAVTGTGPEVREGVLQLVGAADVVKASDEDLVQLFGNPRVDQVARELLELGPEAVVVTRGGEGSTCFLPGGSSAHAEVVPVTVADTIGAGDTFSAAMIDALWDSMVEQPRRGADESGGTGEPVGPKGWPRGRSGTDAWERVLAHASRAAAVTVSRPGADPPYRRELGT
ncbi:carbohydrate kinase [Nocardioides sp. JQ2195]|uniref:carbohydrate kinase family protein n=1 Tax=Nocardioides sp. JQ2195 TaxID=2592334 RepID=UPI00143EE1F6|nr:carbohydrate kinase [Nocardioides sp. JQ2195]QIX25783.1 carbohydrate kinase [Nocardioides sp. JQ2195]